MYIILVMISFYTNFTVFPKVFYLGCVIEKEIIKNINNVTKS